MQLKKRVCAVLAAVCCLGQMALATGATAQYPTWAEIAMTRWADCDKLDAAIPAARAATRAELAVLLDGVMPYTQQAENGFADLPADGAYTAAMLRLAKAGVLQGNQGLMRPNDTITRQEAAVITARAFGFTGQGAPTYTDAADIATWAEDAVCALQETGVMQGFDGQFRPTAQITYAELVVLLDNALETTSTITGLEAYARHEDGVLADGQPAQVNDGKFEVVSVTAAEDGYRVEVRGLAALTGEKTDANGAGAPAKDGKWMGIQLKLRGLVTADNAQLSQEEGAWLALSGDEAFAPAHRGDSVMLYLNGAVEQSATAAEGERTVTVHLRNADGGDQIAVEFHFTPAGK